jgi:hypothetical protein
MTFVTAGIKPVFFRGVLASAEGYNVRHGFDAFAEAVTGESPDFCRARGD